MQGNKSPGVIEAEVAMLRTQSDHALLIVEGPDDSKFWRRWLDSSCEILIGEGKLNIIGCLERLDLKKVRGVLGLVDDDYDHVENVTPDSTNLIMTDANDLECILCRSSALDGILAELGDAGRIERFEAAVGTNVREALLDRALVFGRLRWAARRFKLTLNKIEPTPQFVSESQWTVDVERSIGRPPNYGLRQSHA